ncbi:MAG: hypothetical protein K0V04_36500 [Deltaproteobacteria bacterium]|nr:hypothetical protein [Deltaproteobacteria bacterium]
MLPRDRFATGLNENFKQCWPRLLEFVVVQHRFRFDEVRLATVGGDGFASCEVELHSRDRTRGVAMFITPHRAELGIDLLRFERNGDALEYPVTDLYAIEVGQDFPRRTTGLDTVSTDPDQLVRALEPFATALREHGRRFFNDDHRLWTELAQRYAAGLRGDDQERIRKQAAEAFKNRYWATAIKLLEQLSLRTPLEDKKLRIARKRLR